MSFPLRRNIQYHGPVTFVSVNKATGSVHDLSEVGVGGDHRLPFLQSEPAAAADEAFQGSHTLPRALSAKGKNKKGGNAADHVIITSRPADDGGNSVRIQIGGAQQQQQNLSMNEIRQQQSSRAPPAANAAAVNGSVKRKYSLKEVEVEGLLSSSEEGEDALTVARPGECEQDEEDMFDLNSLIEGAVDDEEEEEAEDEVNAGARAALENSQMYFRPVRDANAATSSAGSLTPKSKASTAGSRLQRVEDDQVSSDDGDFLSMAPNQGSMSTSLLGQAGQAPLPSDTDGDFLDRKSTASTSTVASAKSVVLAKPRVARPGHPLATSTPGAHVAGAKRLLPEKPKLQLSSPLLAPKLKELQQHLEVPPEEGERIRKRSGNNADSDLDSISTTSASYVVNHSDLDSFVIEDQQQEQRQHEMQLQVSLSR